MTNLKCLKVGILIASDRVSCGEAQDASGPSIEKNLIESIENPLETILEIVADEKEEIEKKLITLCDEKECALVVTTGGTGPAPRDLTPEATINVCAKLLPGFGEMMRAVSREKVATAILSRQTAGIRNKSLIINLPGSPKAIAECLSAVLPAIPDCLDVIGGPYVTLRNQKTVHQHC